MAEAQTWPVDGIGVKDIGCGQCGAAAPQPSLAVRSASQGAPLTRGPALELIALGAGVESAVCREEHGRR